ncbi:MAG: ABC transporter permease [Alphaproteobacteria bacterium]|nr:ABC transporter permease [Alphaproteobacteria bacterium]
MTARAAARRVAALMRKETLQVVRDPSSIAIAFVMPLILLLLFGYGVSLDVRHLPVVVVMENITGDTRSLFESFANSPYIRPVAMTDVHAAEAALTAGEVDGIVVLRGDATRSWRGGGAAQAQVIVNGTDANTARFVGAYARGAAATWLQQDLRRRGETGDAGVVIEPRVWFNPELRSTNFLVPGVIAIVMTLIGAMLTALVVAREWERGTMEAMMVTPASMAELTLSRMAVYFVLGLGGMAVSVLMGLFLFHVPLRGSIGALLLATSLFLLGALGLGLLISTAARNQFVAGQIAIVASYMPAFMLSGFIFDIDSMPTVVQWVTQVIPARYFVACLQTLFLAGDVWGVLLPNMAGMAGFAVLFLTLTGLRTRRRLD